ncbi:MAG TPA: hypothetical protein VLA23_13870, partial [Candidatus Limnocylindrales bacterium]|nr:hypothetical protein [Candidatus Limnocylindrales bacterium]
MRRLLGLLGMAVVVGAACGGTSGATPTAETTASAEATPTPEATPSAAASPSGAVATQPSLSQSDLVYATRIRDGATLTLDLFVPAEPLGAPIVLDAHPWTVGALLRAGAIVATFDQDDHIPETFAPEELDFPADEAHAGAVLYSRHGAPIRAIAERFACAIKLIR